MRTHLDIIDDIKIGLQENGLDYEFKSLENEVKNHFNATELIGEVGSLLLKMNEKKEVNKMIGNLIHEFNDYAIKNGLKLSPSKFYSLNQKEFIIDGNDFTDLKGFYNSIGEQLVERNNWGKNWNAFDDILVGGFIKNRIW